MSGTLTISQGSNRTVKVLSNTGLEEFNIPNNNDYQLILQEDCKIRISNNTVSNTTSCQVQTDENSNITMKVLKMSNSETDINYRFYKNNWLKDFNHEVRDNWDNVTSMRWMFSRCSNLTTITLPNTLPKVTTIHAMFYGCASFNGNLSNTKFRSSVDRGSYDGGTPLWVTANKPQFVL